MEPREKLIVASLFGLVLTVAFFIPVYYFRGFIIFLQREGITSLLSIENIIMLVFWIFVISVWILAISKLFKYAAANKKLINEPKKKVQKMKKEMDSIEIFKGVADREYFTSGISEDTYKKVIQMCEEKEVEIKAKLKEMGAEELIKEIQADSEKKKKASAKEQK